MHARRLVLVMVYHCQSKHRNRGRRHDLNASACLRCRLVCMRARPSTIGRVRLSTEGRDASSQQPAEWRSEAVRWCSAHAATQVCISFGWPMWTKTLLQGAMLVCMSFVWPMWTRTPVQGAGFAAVVSNQLPCYVCTTQSLSDPCRLRRLLLAFRSRRVGFVRHLAQSSAALALQHSQVLTAADRHNALPPQVTRYCLTGSPLRGFQSLQSRLALREHCSIPRC